MVRSNETKILRFAQNDTVETTGFVRRSKRFTAIITREEKWYVAHCVELGVVSQGETIEEAQANLKEAVELYVESFGSEDVPEGAGEVMLYALEVAVGG